MPLGPSFETVGASLEEDKQRLELMEKSLLEDGAHEELIDIEAAATLMKRLEGGVVSESVRKPHF